MKKLLSVSIAALAFAAVAEDPVYSPIQVGVEEIATSTSQKNYIIPVPYSTIGSDTAVSVHDLVKAANLPAGTKLYHYNGTSYQVWEVSGGTWTPPSVVTTPAIAGTSVTAGSSDVTIAVGSAVWVVFNTGYPLEGQKIYVYGSPVTTKSSTVKLDQVNLLSNPTTSTVALEGKLSFATKGDRIRLIGSDFSGEYVKADSGWKQNTGAGYEDATLPSIAPYQGFWYIPNSRSGIETFNW